MKLILIALLLAFWIQSAIAADIELRDVIVSSVDETNGDWSPIEIGIAGDTQLLNKETNIYGMRFSLVYVENRNVRGIDIGFGAARSQNLAGIQISGLASFVGRYPYDGNGKIYGIQFSTFGSMANTVNGVQAGAIAGAATVNGIQFGIVPVAIKLNGIQAGLLTGGFSTYRDDQEVRGVQIGAFNFTDSLKGLQFGGVNSAKDVFGVQIGILNGARTLVGIQIGLLNLVENSDVPFLPLFRASW